MYIGTCVCTCVRVCMLDRRKMNSQKNKHKSDRQADTDQDILTFARETVNHSSVLCIVCSHLDPFKLNQARTVPAQFA